MNWRNVQYIKNNSLYFKDRVKLLVFAEMVTKPFEVINDLYDFLDMSPVPSYMYPWILTNTMGSLPSGKYSTFSAYRNTTQVLGKKTSFTQEESSAIEKHCYEVIEFLTKYKKDHNLL